MKTLILSGSPRKHGDTAALLSRLTAQLRGEVLLISAYHAPIAPCTDCRFCRTHERCAIRDGMDAVYDALTDCDNVVIASPLYFSELTGRLLDVGSRLQCYYSARVFRNAPIPLSRKRGAVLLTGGGEGDPMLAYQTAVRLLHYMNAWEIAPLVGSFRTDNLPASADTDALSQVDGIAAFLNRHQRKNPQ